MVGEMGAAIAAMLVGGHALGDFVLQTKWMVDRKDRASGLLAHVGVVSACHLVTLVPVVGPAAALATTGAIAVAHAIIDATKSAVTRRAPAHGLEWFALDQLAHLAVLAVAWTWLAPRVDTPFVDVPPARWVALGTLLAGYAFNVNGMSAVVMLVLSRSGLVPKEEGPSAGRLIGILERMFAVTLILLDRWEALGFLVAAKSLARFRDLDERPRAEYYLVGTLVSLLGATITALVIRRILLS